MMHGLPLEDRPRERLVRKGEDALSMSELLAIIIGNGTRGKNAIRLAEELLISFSGISGLLDASVEELTSIKGMGRAKAVKIKAALAISTRIQRDMFFHSPKITTPKDAFILLQGLFYQKKKEIIAVLLRDIKKRVIHIEVVAIGSLVEVISHPREIFYPAIRKNAHSIILSHNHPSGDVTPSKEDLLFTERLIQSGNILGISLDDHLIISDKSFTSFWIKKIILREIY